ncbi:tRNA (adenosine(37)-N6)-threonylcarbamoyltransferase complex dimerization subunit type 1 TsaB [Granulicella sibirica]|uniref:TsaB protein, required for threonylcarbamoyladenosine (T(6)A) formation in tRNA n=1 Tax=Granulicella sibirica TaxID=2479048 RepID=A0A4Q0T593_9BACT|nr:tRNA (adenosine(37)-N6)-threonylcarbamoyltransferase complex dimerization subunit type 1 TsaB [Granulicella sibirica]RXH56731.1 TsaB protein, required for threonylcarbamoyladenosine (t(6)A) formation in tRNA [Granulicella sibirica]
MRVLLIHTCGVEGSVAVADTSAPKPLLAMAVLPPRTFSEGLMPAIRAILTEAEWTVSDLNLVGVVRGPGSFTGVRTGLSVGKGLAEALDIPLVGVSRLALLASCATADTVHAVLDAGRGEFYYGLYESGMCERESLIGREELVRLIERKGKVAISEEVLICEEKVASELEGLDVTLLPEPAAGIGLGLVLNGLGQGTEGVLQDANYLRRTDGEIFAKAIVGRL